jgi:hypothetical protein
MAVKILYVFDNEARSNQKYKDWNVQQDKATKKKYII